MKNKLFLIVITLCMTLTFTTSVLAQDVSKWGLPKGAKMRLGKGEIHEIEYSPDGTRLAVASSIGVWIYDVQTGAELNLFTGHTKWVWSVSFSPDGSTLASGSADDTIRLWNANTGKHLRTLEGHTDDVLCVSFSPDGSTIASGSADGTIRLWNVNTGEPIRTLSRHTSWVRSVSFSPDGSIIASGSEDGTVILWE
ncbi:MAG: WD40 repeat domain-containing protein [Candidatus Poribacteria bacterium]|nr:WD40 repeat domain-containing protein [Candidatus Poribacteria bacterium]